MQATVIRQGSFNYQFVIFGFTWTGIAPGHPRYDSNPLWISNSSNIFQKHFRNYPSSEMSLYVGTFELSASCFRKCSMDVSTPVVCRQSFDFKTQIISTLSLWPHWFQGNLLKVSALVCFTPAQCTIVISYCEITSSHLANHPFGFSATWENSGQCE